VVYSVNHLLTGGMLSVLKCQKSKISDHSQKSLIFDEPLEI
jgi:hypothetical protein